MRQEPSHLCLGLIPARGGSKGIPGKNKKDFLGKPLVAWTIEAARESGVFARVLLSTEDKTIAHLGQEWGADVPFIRPAHLAEDTTPTVDVVRHAMEWLAQEEHWTPRFVVVLEPTSPTRRPFHIREAVKLLESSGADSVVSVSEVHHHNVPEKILRMNSDGSLIGMGGTPLRKMIHRRQDLPKYYSINGLIFSCKTDCVIAHPPSLWGERVIAYRVESKYNTDLDQLEDWTEAEEKMRRILQGESK